MQSATVMLPLTDELIGIIADEMYQSWKNSPGHYKNMINSDYVLGDIDFQFNSEEKIIYATHVFGKKGVQIKGQFSDNAFGILEEDEFCYNAYGSFNNIVANMGNSIRIQGNKVVFYYYDLDYFNKIFPNSNDGMAIDLFFRDQVSCGSENRIDYSPIYDGIMLRPVFKEEILNKNTAKSNYRIIAEVGTIPDSLISKEFSCSIILIKNGIKCKYLIPGSVPSREYNLRPISPKLKNPTNIKLKKSGIIETQEIAYDFKTNITTPIKYPTIEQKKYPIHSIEITSYSSVEGDEDKNSILHNNRAKTIKNHVSTKLKIQDSKITIDAKENWVKMNFQLRYFLANDLAELSKDSLKNILATNDNSLPWDSLLFNQRRSIATIFYSGQVSDTSDHEKILTMNFRTAISTKNYDLANKALFEMYHKNILSTQFLFEDAIFKTIIQTPELTQNLAALFSKTYKNDQDRTIEFLFNWLNLDKALSLESKTNLIHLYTLISVDLLNNCCLLYTSPSPRDLPTSRMPSSA